MPAYASGGGRPVVAKGPVYVDGAWRRVAGTRRQAGGEVDPVLVGNGYIFLAGELWASRSRGDHSPDHWSGDTDRWFVHWFSDQ